MASQNVSDRSSKQNSLPCIYILHMTQNRRNIFLPHILVENLNFNYVLTIFDKYDLRYLTHFTGWNNLQTKQIMLFF